MLLPPQVPARRSLRWPALLAPFLAAAGTMPWVGPWAAFVCVVPAVTLVERGWLAGDPASLMIRRGAIFGAATGGLALNWMAVALWRLDPRATLLFLLIPVIFAAYGAVAVAAITRLRAWGLPALVAYPVAIAGVHWGLAHQGPLAIPWFSVLAPLASTPVMLQLAEPLGTVGLVAVVAAVNVLLGLAVVRQMAREPFVPDIARAAAIVLLMLGAGHLLQGRTVLTSVGVVGALRTDFDWRAKWDAASQDSVVRYQVRVTREGLARHSRLDLVVWPETSLPGYPRQRPTWASDLTALAAEGAGLVVAGGLIEAPAGKAGYRNALFVADAHRFVPVYAKQHLVPLLEQSPAMFRGAGALAWAGRATAGDAGRLLATAIGPVGFALCHEGAFGRLLADYRQRGARLVVNPSNDAWLSGTLGTRHVEAALVVAAIRYRIAIVRAGNRGRSVLIDPLGRRTTGSGTMVVDTVWAVTGDH